MTNPFNDSPHGRDGTDPEYGRLTTQGFHSLSASDVDGDGKQEIVYGSATIDDDGSVLYSSFDTLPAGSAAPGTEARLGHGDAMHVTDIDPARPGTNMSIKWAADMTTQLINGSREQTPSIDDWKRGRLLTATGTRTNNDTKGNPSLVADVVGDWREEMLVRTADSSALRMFMSTEVTSHKLYTLMQDPQYRAEVARQNTSYNQPSYTDFYLASDMYFADVPLRAAWLPGSVKALEHVLEDLVDSGDVAGPVASQLRAGIKQASKAVADGDAEKAAQAIHRFVDFLGQQKGPDAVSDTAHVALEHNAGNILRAFGS